MNGRLLDASIPGRRVILSVMCPDGSWRQLLNESERKYNRGMSTNSLQSLFNQFGGNLRTWVAGGRTGEPGDYEDDDEVTDAGGYQFYGFS